MKRSKKIHHAIHHVVTFLSFVIVAFTLSVCSSEIRAKKSNTAHDNSTCIDPSKIEPNAICTMEYAPVCGCDKKTYENACRASKSGVLKWTQGACK